MRRRQERRENDFPDCKFSEAPPEHIDTECPVCKTLLMEPIQVSCCGKLICKTCFNTFVKRTEPCPLCRKLNLKGILDRNHQRIMMGFKVYCSHRQNGGGRGCAWIGELGSLMSHLNSDPEEGSRLRGCDFVNVNCKFCKQGFVRSTLAHHEASVCLQRRTKCPHCSYTNTYINVAGDHKNKCLHLPIPCQYCNDMIKKSSMTTHITTQCPEFPLECEYHLFGCKKQTKRKDMANHMIKNQPQHLKLITTTVQRHEQLLQLGMIVVTVLGASVILLLIILIPMAFL